MHLPFSEKFGFTPLIRKIFMVSFYYDAKLMHKIGKELKLSWYTWQCRTGPLLITCLYTIFFYNTGFIGSNSGPFTIQGNAITRKSLASDNVDFMGKLLDTWISWTFWSLEGALGLLTEPFSVCMSALVGLQTLRDGVWSSMYKQWGCFP